MESYVYIIFAILGAVALFIFIVATMIAAFLRSRKKESSQINEHNWYVQLALSQEDALSQLLLVLAGLAAANAVYAINNNIGGLLSWRMILLVAVLIFAAVSYWGKSVYTAAIGIVGFLVWWVAQAHEWQFGQQFASTMPAAVPAGLMWLAIALYAAGFMQMRLPAWKRFGVVYSAIGMLLANCLLFTYSTQFGIESMETMAALFDSWPNLLAVLAISGLTVAALWYSWSKRMILDAELAGLVVLFALFGIFMALPSMDLVSEDTPSGLGLLWAALLNFVLFAEILGIILAGYVRRELWMVNFGAILLIIFVAIKYFDWFFKFLDKSVFFVFAGILLFSVGWAMEKGRRYLAQTIKARANQQ